MSFDIGETVICSIEVRNAAGTLVDPITSMTISIKDPDGTVDLAPVGMYNDDTGKDHYDYQTTGKAAGKYTVIYIATNGTRITTGTDSFRLI